MKTFEDLFTELKEKAAKADPNSGTVKQLQKGTHAIGKKVVEEAAEEHGDLIRKLAVNYLIQAKRGKFPADSVARFHLGNGASVHQLHTGADLSEKGLSQSRGAMVNYLYDLNNIETNHEHYATNGDIEFNDKLKSLLVKA